MQPRFSVRTQLLTTDVTTVVPWLITVPEEVREIKFKNFLFILTCLGNGWKAVSVAGDILGRGRMVTVDLSLRKYCSSKRVGCC